MNFLGVLIMVGLLAFSVWQIKGLINDIRKRKKRRQRALEVSSSERKENR